MDKVAKFEKVSLNQFVKDCVARKIFFSDEEYQQIWEAIKLPTRATSGSAGYDFYSPIKIPFNAEYKEIPTGIRCMIIDGWFMSCLPKSGLGFKYGTRLANTMGVVDADYYRSDNEGHIMVKMNAEKPLEIAQGQKFMQAIFIPFGIVVDDNADNTRNGGFGSTGK